jgi:hypothetical protein
MTCDEYYSTMCYEFERFMKAVVSGVYWMNGQPGYDVTIDGAYWHKQFKTATEAHNDREAFLEAVEKCKILGNQ